MNVFAPLLLSLEVAAIATLCTFFLGLGLARRIALRQDALRGRRPSAARRLRRNALGNTLEFFILTPMVFPPTITGYLLLLLLGPKGPLGSVLATFDVEILFTKAAAVIASAVVSLPLMYQSCKSALLSVEPRYPAAARTLGMSERRIFWRIIFPLARPGIAGGIALAFARALGEFGATLMVAGNIPELTQTLPLALYSAVEAGKNETANILLVIMLVLSFGLVFIARFAERRAYKRRQGRCGGRP